MTDTPIKERDPIAGLTSILDLYNGKQTVTTTSPETSTSTTKSNLTQDQINNQIDMAMAPLNQASHAAGLSTYSDTTLALGRGQVAADTAAKYAGNTTTQSNSGKTTTTTTPGALSAGKIGDTLGALATNQILMPMAKKVLNPISDSISAAIGKGADSIISSIPGFGDSMISGGGDIAGVTVGAGIPDSSIVTQGLDLLPTSEAVTGAISGAGDVIAQGADDLWKWLTAADGGLITEEEADGFAAGGFVDKHVSRSNLTDPWSVITGLFANGDIAPTVADTARNPDLVQQGTIGGGKGIPAPGPSLDPSDPTSPNYGLTQDEMDTNRNSGIVTIAGLVNPILGFAMSQALGAPSLQQTLMTRLTDAMGLTNSSMDTAVRRADEAQKQLSPEEKAPDADMQAVQDAIDHDTSGDRPVGNLQTKGDPTVNSPEGDSNMSEGGAVAGAGTSTSDSIHTMLSDGEYVIDAKTVAALGPEFFQAIQAKFNPAALKSQAAKGRI